jgi:hypothetical protein
VRSLHEEHLVRGQEYSRQARPGVELALDFVAGGEARSIGIEVLEHASLLLPAGSPAEGDLVGGTYALFRAAARMRAAKTRASSRISGLLRR